MSLFSPTISMIRTMISKGRTDDIVECCSNVAVVLVEPLVDNCLKRYNANCTKDDRTRVNFATTLQLE